MIRFSVALTVGMVAAVVFVGSATAQDHLPPTPAADKAAMYTTAIENRTADILKLLALEDPARSNRVQDVIVSQYRVLKARDEVLNAAFGKDNSQRAGLYQAISKPLHDRFLAKLSAELTPEQVEKVKDKMTYGKVQFTHEGYCAIVPGLTDQDKAKILELLKAAREEAMDGGSAGEKSAIFQKYKEQINDYLNAHGHDVAQAYKDWNAKQELAAKAKDESAAKPPQTP